MSRAKDAKEENGAKETAEGEVNDRLQRYLKDSGAVLAKACYSDPDLTLAADWTAKLKGQLCICLRKRDCLCADPKICDLPSALKVSLPNSDLTALPSRSA